MCDVFITPLEAIHNSRKVVILAGYCIPSNGEMIHIRLVQELKPSGDMYGVRERPKGFKQYEAVLESDLKDIK